MACFATPYGLRYAAHCFNRAHAQQSRWALIPAGGNQGVRSGFINRACNNTLSNQIIYNRNAMMLLAAFAAEKERIKSFLGVVRQE